MLAGLARFTYRHKLAVAGMWLVLTIFGMFAASKLSDRWFESFSIPGFSAYEANQRTLKTFGSGEQPPLVAVFSTPGRDVTTVPGIQKAIEAGAAEMPGGRTGSWFETHSAGYVSKDRHTMIATLYPPGNATFSTAPPIDEVRSALRENAPEGVTVNLTGRDPIIQSQGEAQGPSVLIETLIGAVGAIIILLFVFGTLPAVAMP